MMNRRIDMRGERWVAVRALFDELVERTPAERREALAATAHPRDVVAEALALLEAADSSADFMEHGCTLQPGDDDAPAARYQSLAAGSLVGSFRIDRLVGRGGQGEVYRALRADGQFDQVVALKLLRPEAAAQFERFRHERQILAGFEHPGIARLIDGGTAPDGRPYLAMEFVEGQPITEHCAALALGLDARIALLRAVCDAVAYAHRNLIVHRDLKPGNVLVTQDGSIRLLDFGIAHVLLDGAGAIQTLTTQAILTPDYAAPEQFEGRPPTTATDVYALGAILFELTTGRPPWQLRNSPFAGAMRVMRDTPPLPSRSVSPPPWPVPVARLRGDLDIIVAKAMRHEPQERYQSVEALSDDLARVVSMRPISARKGDGLYRTRRFLRRNRVPLAATAAVLLALGGAAGGIGWQARKAAIARQDARLETERSAAARDGIMLLLRAAASEGGPAFATARQALDSMAAQLQREVGSGSPALLRTLGELYGEMGDLTASAALLERYEQAVAGDPRALAEARRLRAAVHARRGERDLAQRLLAEARAYWNRDPSVFAGELAQAAAVEAALLREGGRRDEAITLLRGAVSDLSGRLGEVSEDKATLQHNLGVHLLESGRLDEARQSFDEASRLLEAAGRTRSTTAVALLGHRAALAFNTGDAAGAEAMLRQAIASQRGLYGPTLGLAALDLSLGRMLLSGGRNDDALPFVEEGLGIASAFAGESSVVTIMLRQTRATGLLMAGKPDEAEAEIGRALAASRAAFGDASLYVALALSVRAQIHLQRGNLASARTDLDRVDALLAQAGPASAPHLAPMKQLRTLLEEAQRQQRTAPAQSP